MRIDIGRTVGSGTRTIAFVFHTRTINVELLSRKEWRRRKGINRERREGIDREELILYWMCRVNFGFPCYTTIYIYIYIHIVKACHHPSLGAVDKRNHNFVKSLHVDRWILDSINSLSMVFTQKNKFNY